ncbi:MAG: putative Na+/H+ antiporter [Verrucomicrobiota bacterium]
MTTQRIAFLLITLIGFLGLNSSVSAAGGGGSGEPPAYPVPLSVYMEKESAKEKELDRELTISETLMGRIKANPINLIVTIIFFCAILHTFMCSTFNKMAHRYEHEHQEKLKESGTPYPPGKEPVSFKATLFHFLGEVEAIFGIWVVPLILAITFWPGHGWSDAVAYIDSRVYTEPMFVVVIMAIASTRPVIKFAENCLHFVANYGDFINGTILPWLKSKKGESTAEAQTSTAAESDSAAKSEATDANVAAKDAESGESVSESSEEVAKPSGTKESTESVKSMDSDSSPSEGVEKFLKFISRFGNGTPVAWWFSILTIAPLLGSFITEPAAMTIAAMLLGTQFYKLKPSKKLCYATLGLLFVNVSVGGTLTHFAAPPVLMVATKWNWDMPFMLTHFGWRAFLGIIIANIGYFMIFKKELMGLKKDDSVQADRTNEEPVPVWIKVVHLGFLAWTVATLHHPPFFIGGFLFFLGFTKATEHHQYQMNIKSPMLVGFFLAGLVVHGGLQGWWIAPILSSLGETTLFVMATVLTAFNDNAAITLLASEVPAFGPLDIYGQPKVGEAILTAQRLEYAVVAGAVTGGGLTVIANAPNPAGQSILNKYFAGGISPLGLLLGALIPTLIMSFCFIVLPH